VLDTVARFDYCVGMVVCGQEFTPELLRRIERSVTAEPDLSRRALSGRVCQWLDWRDDRGRLKQMSCRVALRKLELAEVLVLPPAKPWRGAVAGRGVRDAAPMQEASGLAPPECLSLRDLGRIDLVLVGSAHSAAQRQWRALLDRWHYLGSGRPCGAQLRYLVRSERRGIVGALGFSAPAWRLEARDRHIGWSEAARRANLSRVVCNSRFLLVPELKVENLASHVLGLCARRLVTDWLDRYGVSPVLMESFVERDRFSGTSYRAANWVCVGSTRGRGRQDRAHACAVSVKQVYLYALAPHWREQLQICPRGEVSPLPVVPTSGDWAQTEFGRARLGDARLQERLQGLARDFYARPQAQIPQACGTRAKTKAAYRFFDHERTTMDALLGSHYEATAERVREHRVVLAVQDSTSLNYDAQPTIQNLGPIGSRADAWFGLMVHDTMVFTPQGLALGLLDVQCWARDAQDFGKKQRRKNVPIEHKESHKWFKSVQAAAQLQRRCANTTVVSVGDREADIFELFDEVRGLADAPKLLIRAEHNRTLVDEQAKLWEHMRSAPVAGTLQVQLPRQHQRAARAATLSVSYARVNLKPPARLAKLAPVSVWAVLAQERELPAGVKPVCWLLLTSCEVDTFEQATEKLRWYAERWGIEVYHRTLKSGCRIETRQLGSADRIEACLAIDLVVAWRILHLTKLGREHPDVSCTAYFEELQWKALVSFVNRSLKLPPQPPTLREATRMVAALGGFLGRKGDGEPGTQTLWLGLQRLDDITLAYRIFSEQFAQPPPAVSSRDTYG